MERKTQDILGEVLKTARIDMGMTREKFAELVELTPRYIMSIENEGKKPSYYTLCKLIRALGVPADSIFYPENAGADTTAGRVSRLLPQCSEQEIRVISVLVETLLAEKK